MIVQILGANGAGKSTIVRELMNRWPGGALPCHVPKRRRPLYYILPRFGHPPLIVLGHYEIANGGCDTIGSVREIKKLIDDIRGRIACTILMEGKTGREPSLVEYGKENVSAVLVDTPVEECVARVRKRGHKIAEHVIANAHKHARALTETYRKAGIEVLATDDIELLTWHVMELVGFDREMKRLA